MKSWSKIKAVLPLKPRGLLLFSLPKKEAKRLAKTITIRAQTNPRPVFWLANAQPLKRICRHISNINFYAQNLWFLVTLCVIGKTPRPSPGEILGNGVEVVEHIEEEFFGGFPGGGINSVELGF